MEPQLEGMTGVLISPPARDTGLTLTTVSFPGLKPLMEQKYRKAN